ncbi:uncharacterized protein C8A04DRAFT_11704 [Dichotomopilus funicola]|uniref:C2H2-type domain-containing protein n=1 Tax=Dichotomopilus funicola TaxID=1934379 RepID=A0AAN6ZMS0_9PEZI|nr:hypothetical protein C8A04DRAFT_11704 [Dichotomopilus funicola]
MANPHAFGDAAFSPEDMPFGNPSYHELESNFGISSMSCIDPSLSNTPSDSYLHHSWAAPAHHASKENHQPIFLAPEIPVRTPSDHSPIQTAAGITSHPRFTSPLPSFEHTSSNVLSPSDTESYYDNYPTTPPDTTLFSPSQAPLPLEGFAHAMQFGAMGPNFPNFVRPFDINPNQQPPEYSESDAGLIDFNTTAGYYDTSPIVGFGPGNPQLEQMPVTDKEDTGPMSQYPPLEETAHFPGDVSAKRPKNDSDEDYQPRKRRKSNARATGRRGAKATTTVAATSSPSRRTRARATNPAPATVPRTIPSSSAGKFRSNCPDCKRAFPSRGELETHIKKEHHRPFNCVFDFAGCESTFATKNEWKRHVLTQHLLLYYWACQEGTCENAKDSNPEHPQHATSPGSTNPTGNIFNRKDLYTQHLKRMHAPPELKDILPPPGKRSSSSTSKSHAGSKNSNNKDPATATLEAKWNDHVKQLQAKAMHPRCHLPTLMRCPVPDCGAEAFRGENAWNLRMEHVAKHMDRTRTGGAGSGSKLARGSPNSPNGKGVVVFGGEEDPTLVQWASSKEVAIIVPRESEAGHDAEAGDGEEDTARGKWILRSPLKRGPGGNVVVEEEEDAEEDLDADADADGDEDAEGEEDDLE